MIVMTDCGVEEKNLSPEQEGLILIGKMASGIMHDVNNILTTIQGYSTLMMLQNKDGEVKEYVEVIQRCVSDGKEIVNRIKKLSKKKDYIIENIEVKEQIDSVVKLTKPIWHNSAIAMGKNIDVVVKCNENIYVKGNENELREALMNLIMNAIDAIEDNGTIYIKSYIKDSMAVIEVVDTGCGMNEDTVSRIFEPFFSTKGEKGNGLGLSMVKEIIERMEGNIHVKSKEGEGSSMVIDIPVSAYKKCKSEEIRNIKLKDEIRVLILDDQQEVGSIIRDMIIMLSNVKAEAVTGYKQALDMMNVGEFDLLITDMIMPEINGIDFIRIVRKAYPKIKCAIMTGFTDNEGYIFDNRADYILHKPFTLEELQEMIASLCRKEDNQAV